MSNATCNWIEGCVLPLHGAGLCKRHWQRAKRNGSLGQYRLKALGERRCEECGEALPITRRPAARFCSRRCLNVSNWRDNKPALLAAHRAWRDETRDARLAKNVAKFADKTCSECGETIRGSRRSTRKFCSRYCINQARMRDKPEQGRQSYQRYRAKKRGGDSRVVTERDWLRLVRRYGNRCAYCGAEGLMTRDHVIPLSRGGRHSIGNLLPACMPCNSSKRAKFLAEWRLGA